jgi:hypothetical protein
MDDWLNISYMQRGSERQQAAYRTLLDSDVLTVLAEFEPTLVGPLPLGMDGSTSVLELLCYAERVEALARDLRIYFQDSPGFELTPPVDDEPLVCRFIQNAFTLEIRGYTRRVELLPKYGNMSIISRLLRIAGDDSRRGIQALLLECLALEAAVAGYFLLPGEPEQALANLQDADYAELEELVAAAAHARMPYALLG